MKIILTAEDGEKLTGKIPDSWAQVPLAGYAALAVAETLPARVEATAALVGLPAAPLLEEVRHFAHIAQAAPWLFAGPLPATETPVAYFTHQGKTYRSSGDLSKLTAGQLEALYTFQQAHPDRPLEAGPGLLAVLFCPEGEQQTPEVVRDAAAALASLPMSIAWPALNGFFLRGATYSVAIRTALDAQAQVAKLLAAVEEQMNSPAHFSRFWQRPLRWLTRHWLTNVRKTAAMSSNW